MATKRDPKLEAQAKEWMEAVVGEPYPPGSYAEALKDGIYLCKLINKLQPGSVPKIDTSKMAIKQMRNIANFLEAATRYGVVNTDLFRTVDLYEAQNIPQVTNGIIALGRMAHKNGYDGPVLGKEFHEFDEEGGKAVIGVQTGINKGASHTGMSYGITRHQ